MSRMFELTSREEQWMERLTASDLMVRTFTADEAVATLSNIPLKSGKLPKVVPNKYKLQYVMRKSDMFVLVEGRNGGKKINSWRLKNA